MILLQGSAADLIKIAMINIHSFVVGGNQMVNLNNDLAGKFSQVRGCCRISLQVVIIWI